MSTLAEYEESVSELEGGKSPRLRPDWEEAISDLVRVICETRWRSAGDRDGAQALVCRLEVLRRRRDEPPAPALAAPRKPQRQAKR